MLENLPVDDFYLKLKETILVRTKAADNACLKRLLSSVKINDRTPSRLLLTVRSLVGNNNVDDVIRRSLWIR